MFLSFILYFTIFSYTTIMMDYVDIFIISIKEKSKRLYEFFQFIIVYTPIMALYGLRVNVGIDYPTYLSFYNVYKYSIHSITDLFNQQFEPGYVLLNKLGYIFFHNDNGVFLISGIVIFFLLNYLIKQYHNIINKPTMIFIFIMVFFGASCNIVRQIIAMLIIAIGYKYLIHDKYKEYILICFIASLFHKTALLCILLILFHKINKMIHSKTRNLIIIISIAVLILGPFIIQLLSKSSFYKITYEKSGLTLSSLLFLLYLVPELVFMEKLKKNIKKNTFEHLNELICIYYLVIPFQLMDLYSTAFQRIAIYFSILQIIIIPIIIHNQINSKRKLYLKIIVFLWYILFFIMTEIILVGNGLFPYHCLFW